jgi:hypothetical protein
MMINESPEQLHRGFHIDRPRYGGPAAAVWVVLGIIYGLVLRSRTPQAIADVSRVHLDEEPAEESAT